MVDEDSLHDYLDLSHQFLGRCIEKNLKYKKFYTEKGREYITDPKNKAKLTKLHNHLEYLSGR